MDKFYIIVLSVATVFLILILTFMGILLRSQDKNIAFPPTANICPDYWTLTDSSFCVIGNVNRGDIPDSGFSTTDTTQTPYTTFSTQFDPTNTAWNSNGMSAICNKRQWANSHNIVWDGVSNYNSC